MGNIHCCENKTLNDKIMENTNISNTPIQKVNNSKTSKLR